MDIKSLPIKVMATATLLSVTAVPIAQSTNPVQHVAHGAETQATEKITINDDVKDPNWKKLVNMNDQVDGKDATSIRFDDSKVEYGKEGTYDLIVTGQDKDDAELKQTIPVTIKKASDSNKDTPEIKRDSKDVDWANQLNISDEVDGQKVSDVKVDDSDVDVSKAGTYTVYVSGITDSGETVVDTYQVKVSEEAEDGSTSDDSNATSDDTADDTSDNAKADDKKDDSAGIDIVPDDEKGDDAKVDDSDADTSSDDKSDDTSADDNKDDSKSDDAKADDKSDDTSSDDNKSDDAQSDDSTSSDDSSASGSSDNGKSSDAKADDKKGDSAGIDIVPDDEKDGAKDGDKSDDKADDKVEDKNKDKDADKSDNDATVNDEDKPSSESSDDKDKADEDKADESEDATDGGQPESDVSQPKPVPSESTPEQTSPQDDTQQPEGEGKGENPQELPDTGSETDNSPIIGGIVMMASAILGLASYLFVNRKKKSNQE